jgi:pyrimidine operon attenuation protein/uracil phosphoribosyltransferase|tara:strand:+ start:177 stop:674 length:498 start_codon:yes stop_codon:yes gene_type:complete
MQKFDTENLILNKQDVENKIQRIGLEILEDNINCSKIILFGISDSGKLITQKLMGHINKISNISADLIQVNVNNESLEYDNKFNILNQSIVIIGDVSQSGKTLQMVISDLMKYKPSKIKTSVIINRDHSLFPVKIDYSGLILSTSVKEHVDVVIDKNGDLSVYLS